MTITITIIQVLDSHETGFLQGCSQKLYKKVEKCNKECKLISISLEAVIPLEKLHIRKSKGGGVGG